MQSTGSVPDVLPWNQVPWAKASPRSSDNASEADVTRGHEHCDVHGLKGRLRVFPVLMEGFVPFISSESLDMIPYMIAIHMFPRRKTLTSKAQGASQMCCHGTRFHGLKLLREALTMPPRLMSQGDMNIVMFMA